MVYLLESPNSHETRHTVMNKQITKIVLTGGPCGGKSTAIERIKTRFSQEGYTVLVISEVATDLITGGVAPWTCGTNKDYQESQLLMQITKEQAFERAAATMPGERILIVCDRGVMDNCAYMADNEFSEIVRGLGYSESNLLLSYSAIFHMETGATAGFYTTENNAARTESPETAMVLDAKIRRAWSRHPAFHFIANCHSFEDKIDHLLTAVDTHLHATTQESPKDDRKKTVFAIGRWMPIHRGHKQFLVGLARQFDRLVVGIGSCYENGTPRNCIPAIEREVLLRKIFRHEGIPDEKIEIIPVSDKETFEEWINDIIAICEHYGVTHFCTGNKEDILNVLAQKNIRLGLELIDPEENSDVSFHATDVRNAILAGNDDDVRRMIPTEIIDMVKSQVAREIRATKMGQGRAFIPGKQTVDVVLLDREADGETYVLLGRRSAYKRDFAGYNALPGSGILDYESAADAALRVLRMETGVDCSPLDRASLPMPLELDNELNLAVTLHFINIFASSDMAVNGTLGGASQCFAITTDGIKDKLTACLYSRHDLEDLRFVNVSDLSDMDLAYEQKSMIYEALDRLGMDCPEERFDVLHEDGTPTGKRVTRREAHRHGVLHGASHVCIYRKTARGTEILLQQRSADKDSYPSCYDLASAGHREAGSTFPETACKELAEELGLRVEVEALRELFSHRISDVSRFHGEVFHNEEICRIYGYEADLDTASLTLQASEVSGVQWFDLAYVTEQIRADNPLFCTNKDEFLRLSDILSAL